LTSLPAGSRRRAIEQYVHALAVRILGFDVNRRVDPRQPLHELGLDSLMAVEFRNALAAALETTLPATILFSYPAIEDLVNYVETMTTTPVEASVAVACTVAASSGVLDSIADLSDEEVDRLLAEKLGARS
jgi:acyl carrier protein